MNTYKITYDGASFQAFKKIVPAGIHKGGLFGMVQPPELQEIEDAVATTKLNQSASLQNRQLFRQELGNNFDWELLQHSFGRGSMALMV